MKMFNLANLLTLTNLLMGCIITLMLLFPVADYKIVSIPLSIALICDFLDGWVARKTRTAGPFGVQLDSLADMVTFGLVPGILFSKILNMFFPYSFQSILFNNFGTHFFTYLLPILPSFFITLFSALRLAKFNVESENSSYFKGLNTPTNTLAIYSLFYIVMNNPDISISLGTYFIFIAILILSCYLLISNIPMFSLKFQGFDWKKDYYLIIYLLICIIAWSVLGIPSIVFLVLLYVIVSLIFRKQFTN